MLDGAPQTPSQIDFIDAPLPAAPTVDTGTDKQSKLAAEKERRAEKKRTPTEPAEPLSPTPTSPSGPAPASPAQTSPSTAPTPSAPAPTIESEATTAPAPSAPVSQGDRPSITTVLLGVEPPVTGQTLSPGLPDVVEFAQNAPVKPGDSTSFAGIATVTVGGDESRITDVHNPVTGDSHTTVRNKFGALVAESTSHVVPGTGGLTRDTTIVDQFGISQVRTVDDGFGNLITWTANPDGSHSVFYHKTNVLVVEPAPGSSTPAQVVQLSPDRTSGHVTMWHSNGETSTADFSAGLFGAPVTTYTRSGGTAAEVLTVPGQTNGQPISIVTDPLGNRAVVQPDGTTTPVDKYNTAIGGPGYGNKFDPASATWIADPIIRRGPMVQVPDGTTVQKWFGRRRDGSEYELTAYFDKQGNLRGVGDEDYTGIKYTSFSSVDGIYVPTDTIELDAGNVTDDRQIVFDAVFIASGIPEMALLGARIGMRAGSWYFGRQLAGQGAALTSRELAIAGLGAGDGALTGLARGSGATTSPSLPYSPQVRGRVPVPDRASASPRWRAPSANAPRMQPNALLQGSISVSASAPRGARSWPVEGVAVLTGAARARLADISRVVPNFLRPSGERWRSAMGSVSDKWLSGFASAGGSLGPSKSSYSTGGISAKAAFKTNSAIDRTLAKVNPRYREKGTGSAYSDNCTSCVVAYEMKRRGLPGAGYAAGPLEEYLRRENLGPGGRPIQVLQSLFGAKFKAGNRQAIESAFSKNGSRGIVYIEWKDGGAHVFSVENVAGVVRFVDSQPTPVLLDASHYFGLGSTAYMRVDNLPTPKWSGLARFIHKVDD
ncbi:toxin glutamine deamidase domain-containing protein [Nocardia lijiangensis]|uniref:toxin glutamine deamidase domain-containing protein n=1 Tax=Nocardia lijiangensis TaxID=299618 RepID=UPI003D7548BA